MSFRLKLARVINLKLKVATRLPAQLVGGNAIIVRRENAVYTIDFDPSEFADVASVMPEVEATTYVFGYEAAGNSFYRISITNLKAEIAATFNGYYQPLDADLTAVAALSSTGIARRTGAGAWSVGTAVANSELATMTAATIKGRASGAGTGVPVDLTAAQATATLNAFVGDSGSGGTKGLVPAPVTGDATRFLRGDGAFAAIPGGLSNSAVSGASTTYVSGQNNTNVRRSNSGAAMADTLPGTGSFLPANTLVTITNADASALLAISAASGATIKGNAFNGRLYLGPGQTVAILSDGTDYWPVGYPVRTRLAANTTIFVATTGNDTTGSGIASGSAFLTTNRAWAFAQSRLDLNGFVLTIQHAAGTYSTNTNLTGSIVGQAGPASVLIQGDLTTPTNCAMPGTGSGVTIAGDLGAQFQVQGFAISSASGQGLRAGSGSIVNYQTISMGITSGSEIAAASGGVIQVVGNYTITSGSHSLHWNANAGGRIVMAAAATITLTSTPSYSLGFALAQTAGIIFFDFAPTYSGSATGVRWSAVMNGTIATGGVSFPGSTAGSASTGGQFA